MAHVSFSEITERITRLQSTQPLVLVAIDGPAGSGKTTFAQAIADSLRATGFPISVVKTDLFVRPVSERWTGSSVDMPIGYDLDWERLRDQVIIPPREGSHARAQLYDWVSDELGPWQVIKPVGVTIIDGVFSLRNELASHYDLRIWLECPHKKRLKRLSSRGDTPQHELDWWLPIERRYVKCHNPAARADFIINAATLTESLLPEALIQIVRLAPDSHN